MSSRCFLRTTLLLQQQSYLYLRIVFNCSAALFCESRRVRVHTCVAAVNMYPIGLELLIRVAFTVYRSSRSPSAVACSVWCFQIQMERGLLVLLNTGTFRSSASTTNGSGLLVLLSLAQSVVLLCFYLMAVLVVVLSRLLRMLMTVLVLMLVVWL